MLKLVFVGTTCSRRPGSLVCVVLVVLICVCVSVCDVESVMKMGARIVMRAEGSEDSDEGSEDSEDKERSTRGD